jgi:hypothetical protein
MTIRRHLIGNMTDHSNSLREKLLGRIHISLFASPRIN